MTGSPGPQSGSSRPRLLRGLRPTIWAIGRQRTYPPIRLAAGPGGNQAVVPTFTLRSIGQVGAWLYPGSIATATPQTFTMASPPLELDGFGVPPTTTAKRRKASALQTGPYPPGSSTASRLRGVGHQFTRRVTPSDLARRTRIVWQCRHAPTSSGPLATLTVVPRLGLPPASPHRCDGTVGTVSHHPSITKAPRGAQLRREEN